MDTVSNHFPIVFRLATAADREDVRDALGRFFYPDEPVTSSYYGGSEVTADDMHFTLSMIDDGFVILAVDKKNGKIVGLSIGGIIEPDEPEKLLDLASKVDTVKFADILLFLAHMAKGANICQRFTVAKAYHIHCLAVAPEVRGRSLGKLLMKKQFEQAEKCGVEVVSTDATGLYSAQLFKQLGMTCVYSVPYNEYRNESQQQVFAGRESHLEAKTFTMAIGHLASMNE
ncbi:uncharacterized protein LOC131690508 [Topomyia yanbarensis]|uniref:uncharacterized protein LOC131690508 n=1 Tax=Topomyia yanbarensis TaxID=2498891 RepID=UPI00273B3FF0|nr:uncharacterized protein LOC131690508 [Topomyia yanbarensis]